jgi:hypothetical protein
MGVLKYIVPGVFINKPQWGNTRKGIAMKTANPGKSARSVDELRFKVLRALTNVVENVSPQTIERMRIGSAIEDALARVAVECVGIDWDLVYSQLGLILDKRFDLTEIAGVRKIPMMPEVTTSLLIACLEQAGCGVDLRIQAGTAVHSDDRLDRICRNSYVAAFPDHLGRPLSGKTKAETEALGVNEPRLEEWLLFQYGYFLGVGDFWDNQVFIRCGGSFVFASGEKVYPAVCRPVRPDNYPVKALKICLHAADMDWNYQTTRPVTRRVLH